MTGLERIRRRVPLVVFLLLLVLAVLIVGFACACFSGQPLQAIERTLAAAGTVPAVVEMWAALALVAAMISVVYTRRVALSGDASPADLQCFQC